MSVFLPSFLLQLPPLEASPRPPAPSWGCSPVLRPPCSLMGQPQGCATVRWDPACASALSWLDVAPPPPISFMESAFSGVGHTPFLPFIHSSLGLPE